MVKPRKPAPAPRGPAGVRWRGGRAYYEREHARLAGGRIAKTLGTRDPDLAHQYAAALNTLTERGDWGVLERWRDDEVHVTDIARAVRDGDYQKLRRLSAEGTRLGDAIDRFERRTAATLKPKTLEGYSGLLGLLRAARGDDYPMALETRESAEAFLHEPKATAGGHVWQPATQGIARTVYGALWKMVIEDEAEAARKSDLNPAVTDNPWKRTKVPELRTTRHEFLQPAQWRALVAHPDVAGTREAAFLGCACLAGLRQQEIANLRTGTDVDLAKGVLRVQDRKGKHAWTAKKSAHQRDVPIVPALRELLERHVEQGFAGERFFFRGFTADRPIAPQTAKQWTVRCFKAAGIRYGRKDGALTLHSLRHTFGSWLALDGVPFHVIASLMGNTPAVVMRVYSHLAPSDRVAAMQRVQERVS